ncbi:hypothetical protein PHMEG_00016699, partial [Phytophthora megakarya]
MRLPYRHTIAFRKRETPSGPVIPWASSIPERWTNPLRKLEKVPQFAYERFNDSFVGGSAKRTRAHAQRYTDAVRSFRLLASKIADIEEEDGYISHEAISDQHFDIAEQMKEPGEASDTPDETSTGSSAVRIKLNPKARKAGVEKNNINTIIM